MKNQLKNYFSIGVAMMLLFYTSCEKSGPGNNEETHNFLDVNINFTGVAPEVGSELHVNLFYEDVAGKTLESMSPNEVVTAKLTSRHIDQGLRVTFEGFKEVPVAYISAYVDVDGDGKPSIGDIGMFYNDISYEQIVNENVVPDNVGKEYAVTMSLNRVIEFKVPEEPEEPGVVTDVDGNVYETVIIGNQEWIVQNLKVTKYRNGDPISTGLGNTEWADATEGAYSIYPFDAPGVSGVYTEADMVNAHGLLYNWHAVNDERGLAPEGWRVATNVDWKILEMFAGMSEDKADITATGWRRDNDEGGKLKSVDNWNGTDDYGFSAVPSGARTSSGNYAEFGIYNYLWLGTEESTTHAHRSTFRTDYLSIHRGNYNKKEGYSVRCVRDVD